MDQSCAHQSSLHGSEYSSLLEDGKNAGRLWSDFRRRLENNQGQCSISKYGPLATCSDSGFLKRESWFKA